MTTDVERRHTGGLPQHDHGLRFHDMHIAWEELKGVQPGDGVHIRRAFYPPGFAFPLHDNGFPEVVLISTGTGWHDTPTSARVVRAGDLIAIGAAHRHRFHSDAI